MIERVHRTLKEALRAQQNTDWYNNLPLVLLGMRTTIKEGLNSSPAEILYGENITIPGDFLTANKAPIAEHRLLHALHERFDAVRPVPPAHHRQPKNFVNHNLQSTDFVFVRRDGYKKPLQAPYSGPYKIIRRADRTFVIDINGKEKHISIERLKPAFVVNLQDTNDNIRISTPTNKQSTEDAKQAEPTAPKTNETTKSYTTRSGRHVRFRF
jgi:cleavage and polyadenylation specificity factor subunit 1